MQTSSMKKKKGRGASISPALVVRHCDMKDCDVTYLAHDSRKHNQKTSKERFVFHEHVLRDQKNLTKYALALAGFIMHEPSTSEGVSFRISLRKAERVLGIQRAHLRIARDLLAQRGHLIPLKEKTGIKGRRDQATQYFFGEGGILGKTRRGRVEDPLVPVGFSEERILPMKKDSKPRDSLSRAVGRVLPLVRVVNGGRS